MTQTLRKRDKKKEKARVEAAALKKKKIMEGVLVEGPKRGKGRRKRERLEKVKVRLEEARRKLEEKEKQGK
jgi:signal recognition particle subunit SRP14